MKVFFSIPSFAQPSNKKYCTRPYTSALRPLPFDSVSFKAIKKSKLDGFDLACVNMYKAPLEKFNSKEDLNRWAKSKLFLIMDFEQYACKHENYDKVRKERFKNWENYLKKPGGIYEKSPALCMIIAKAITKELTYTNKEQPPLFNEEALNKTLELIENNLKADSHYQFNFDKIYRKELRSLAVKNTTADTASDGKKWVKIPSYHNDKEHFEDNVKKLQALSRRSWCTKTDTANTYLNQGDFHILTDDAKTKICIRMKRDEIEEVQGKKNNHVIPIKYIDEIKEYIKENNLDDTEVFPRIVCAEFEKIKYEKAKADLKEAIEKNDSKKIFAYFGIDVKEKDGKKIIPYFKQPDIHYTFKDLGVDEKQLLKDVVKIEGDADFRNCTASALSSLKEIGGNANFRNSNVENLSGLIEVGGDLFINKSSVTNLDNLTYVGGDFECGCPLKHLPSLKGVKGTLNLSGSMVLSAPKLNYVGRNLALKDSQITTLDALYEVGGKLLMNESEIVSMKNLYRVGRTLYLMDSVLQSLPSLEEVSEDIMFENSKITSMPKLRTAGSMILSNSIIEKFESLQRVQGDLDLRKSNAKEFPALKRIEGDLHLRPSKMNIEAFKNVRIDGDINS